MNKMLVRSIGVAFVTSVILALLSSFIVNILTDDPVIKQMVLTLVWMSILLEPARMINEIIIGALNTAGDVKYPTVLTIVITFIFTVPMSFLIGVYWGYGLVGVWIVFIIDEWIKAIILYIRWKRDAWQSIKLFADE